MSIQTALKEAKKAKHKQHRLGAVLLKGGKPIASGHNFGYIHAEHAVLNKAWRSNVDGCTLMVVRIRKDGSLGMAKPCYLCMERIIRAGIRKLIYSGPTGEILNVKLSPSIKSVAYLEYHFIDRNTRRNKNA